MWVLIQIAVSITIVLVLLKKKYLEIRNTVRITFTALSSLMTHDEIISDFSEAVQCKCNPITGSNCTPVEKFEVGNNVQYF